MKSVCRSSSLIPSRGTAHFYLLAVLIALYMLAGAAVFSYLERPAELQAQRLWEERMRDFIVSHKTNLMDVKQLLRHYEEARRSGVRPNPGRALWELSGSFYFVGTVVSTIGFGVSAPSTTAGKVLLVVYGLLGCSATLLFFNLFLERIITFLGRQSVCCRRAANAGDRKPSVCRLTLVLLVTVLLVACAAASVYCAMEGWTYFESLYFCFVAFSTVGFGDFVSGQREHHEDTWAYQVGNCLLMLFGVCCTYSLFNAVAVVIKQGLGHVLDGLARVREDTCRLGPRLGHLFRFSRSESERTSVCYLGGGALPGPPLPPIQTVSSSVHCMLWCTGVPSAIGNYLCDEAAAYHRHHGRGEENYCQSDEIQSV